MEQGFNTDQESFIERLRTMGKREQVDLYDRLLEASKYKEPTGFGGMSKEDRKKAIDKIGKVLVDYNNRADLSGYVKDGNKFKPMFETAKKTHSRLYNAYHPDNDEEGETEENPTQPVTIVRTETQNPQGGKRHRKTKKSKKSKKTRKTRRNK